MRKRTPETLARIQELQKPESFWQRLFRTSEGKVRLLQEIGDSGEIAVIPDIIAFVLADDQQIAIAATEAVNHLLSSASPEDLVWLDEQMRIRLYITYGTWYDLRPQQVDVIQRVGSFSVSLLGAASFHGKGFVRERAITLLAEIRDGRELPYLLIRANDWVSQVRSAAQEAIQARLIPEYAGHFMATFSLVERLLHSERADHGGLVQSIFGFMQDQEVRAVLHAGFTASNRQVRRLSYRLAVTAPGEDVSLVLTQALREHDPMIRTWAAQQAAAVLEQEALQSALSMIAHDPYMPVRQIALLVTVEHFPTIAHDVLLDALLDTNATIREVARYYLRRQAPMDFAAFYRDALDTSTGNGLLGAIHGIGETGTNADAERLLPCASQRSIRTRKAAIAEIARLHQGDQYLSLFMQALVHALPGMSNAGREALRDRAYLLDTGWLAQQFKASPYVHVRKNILRLLARLGKWPSLPYLIRATCDTDARIVLMATRLLKRWLLSSNRYFIAPTAEQLAEIRAALENCQLGLDEEDRRQILFMLRG